MTNARFALGVSILLFIVACERLDTVETMYPDAQAALRSGAVERGWIPAFLPPSAKSIRERHNLDTNEIWLRFSIDPGEIGFVERFCHRVTLSQAIFPRTRGGEWWPELLTEEPRGIRQQADRYGHYRCANGGALAVEDGGQTVFYWRQE